MIEIDGARHSGSGTIVRQAVMFSALTRRGVHIVNARARRPKPGLRPQHVRVVDAIGELVQADTKGVFPGSMELSFEPGPLRIRRQYLWDIGSAGSTTMLGLAVLPVLLYGEEPVTIELHGGVFQDYAPALFHTQYALLPLLGRMGIEAEMTMERPGYVPRGDGVVQITVRPLSGVLRSIKATESAPVQRCWGIALASHLAKRRVAERMAKAAGDALAQAGYEAHFDILNDTKSRQPGAALAAFGDRGTQVRLGADRAGALGRSAETIGRAVASQLLADLGTGATLDRYAADQVVPFSALAEGISQFRIPANTEHVQTNAWLAEQFLGAVVLVEGLTLSIKGVGFRPSTG